VAVARVDPSGEGDSAEGDVLIESAEQLRWRAPELSLVIARRAAAFAAETQDQGLELRANALAVGNLVRLGRHAEAVRPAVTALGDAESAGRSELAAKLRVDLASSSRSIGIAGAGFAILRAVLDSADAPAGVRASALAESVSCLAHLGRREELDDALAEADRLFAADTGLWPDTRRLLRAVLCARTAAYRRRHGDPSGAVAAVSEGLALLDGLSDQHVEGGQARARLTLELVCALLDDGEQDPAWRRAEEIVAEPQRATSAAAAGRLMLVAAMRILIPTGRLDQGRAWLGDAARLGERHGLEPLLVDALTALAHVQELAGEPTAALESLRRARAAEYRHLRAATEARMMLVEQLRGSVRVPEDAASILRAAVRNPAQSQGGYQQASEFNLTSAFNLEHEFNPEHEFGQQPPAPAAWRPEEPAPPATPRIESPQPEEPRPPEAPRHPAPQPAVSEPAPQPAPQRPVEAEPPSAPPVQPQPVAQAPAQAQPAPQPVAAPQPDDRDPETGLLSTLGLRRKVTEVRADGTPTALTLVRLESPDTGLPADRPDDESRDEVKNLDPESTDRFSVEEIREFGRQRAGRRRNRVDARAFLSLVGHVRGLAPPRAVLARTDEGELAVLLPDTTMDQAEEFVAGLRESVATTPWLTHDPGQELRVSIAVAQYTDETSDDRLLGATREALLAAAREHGYDQPDDYEADYQAEGAPEFEQEYRALERPTTPEEDYAYLEQYLSVDELGAAAESLAPSEETTHTHAAHGEHEKTARAEDEPQPTAEQAAGEHRTPAEEPAESRRPAFDYIPLASAEPYMSRYESMQPSTMHRDEPASAPPDPGDPAVGTTVSGYPEPAETGGDEPRRHRDSPIAGRHGTPASDDEGDVLAKLGISGRSGGGGRRRAREGEEAFAEEPVNPEEDTIPLMSVPKAPEPDEVPETPEPPNIPTVPSPDLPQPQPEVPLPESDPQPAEPHTAPEAAEGEPGTTPARPFRSRRRQRGDVGLADLLAEALVAYQSTTSERIGDRYDQTSRDSESRSSQSG
jgi:hypothetical protein